MKESDNNTQAFFAMLRAGLWEKSVRFMPFGKVDFEAILSLSDDQSVVGLVAAGLEHIVDLKPAKKDVLQFIGRVTQLEQRNRAMNSFIGGLVDTMRKEGIYTLLVKGQGVAQCYERPLWRACGDVDFFLNDDSYEKAKKFLMPLASSVEKEVLAKKHIGMTIDSWVVELHGSLHSGLSSRIDDGLDLIKKDVFLKGNVRSWMNGDTQVFLLGPNNDVLYFFTHILQHFYKGGIGLRQICDWCRLLWTYRTEIDLHLLEKRLLRLKLMTEWKAFGAFVVSFLGMPVGAMPFYSANTKWKRKAERIKGFVMMSGNFGHKRDMSYYSKYPFFVRKAISMKRRIEDLLRHAVIFPLDSLRYFPKIMTDGFRNAVTGE